MMPNGGAEHVKSLASSDEALLQSSLCEECDDRRAVWECSEGCHGDFCDVCFHKIHRKGKRALHKAHRKAVAEDRQGGGGALLIGGIGPRSSREEMNPDIYDR